MQSFPYHLRVEGRVLRSRVGNSRALLIHAAVILVFGVFLPWNKGLAFMDPVITAAYACLGILFAAPAAAQSFAGEPPESMGGAMARILMAVLYGECMAAAMLLIGFATVYLTHWHRIIFGPELETLAWAAVLGVAGSLALAAGAVWISLRFSPIVARTVLRVVFILILVTFLYRSQRLPDFAATGALMSAIVATAELFALWLAFRPKRG
jgi:hypothetical protein